MLFKLVGKSLIVLLQLSIVSTVVVAFHHHRYYHCRQQQQPSRRKHLILARGGGKRTDLFESLKEEETAVETFNKKTNDNDNGKGYDEEIADAVKKLKSDLFDLADRSKRGFTASVTEKRMAKQIIESLQKYYAVTEPASAYYDQALPPTNSDNKGSSKKCSITGKWTLIYTTAPDIIGLDTSKNPFSTAQLGRIGQDCTDPPYIKNVIEWVRPDWAQRLPFSGGQGGSSPRIFQKIVITGSAESNKPTFVDLKVAGIEIVAADDNRNTSSSSSSSKNNTKNIVDAVQNKGLPAGILSMNPIDLKGPWNPRFGKFEILYLDDEIRIIRTGQNYLAVNRRIVNIEDEWF